MAEESRGVQVYAPAQERGQFVLQALEADEPDPSLRLELHKNIQVTLRSKVISKYRAEKRHAPDAVAAAKTGNRR